VIEEVFEPADSEWRGIGIIPKSGLEIRSLYSDWNTEIQIPVKVEPSEEPRGCLCGQILQGIVEPPDCRHFGKTCTPGNPVGPCMVSSEGTCAAYFKYRQI
jgi:hydrogenase expression/formation protein HypD